MHQIGFWLGLLFRPSWKSLQHRFTGLTFKEMEGKEQRKKGEKGKEWG